MNNKIIVHDSNDNNNLNNDNVKIDVPLKPKINQIKSQINIQIVKMQNVFSELKVQDKEIYQKLFISIKENNIQYSSLTLSELTKYEQCNKFQRTY
ncbi:MAG: hypothetical protein ACPKQO_05910 [Nitrososphaeraceae archaeon]